MTQKKVKILTISDHPLSPSGVAHQTKNMIEALLETGKFEVVSLGGAIKHKDKKPVKTDKWGDDWVIQPVDGYGTQEMIRSTLRNERPDILWFMTDPRFWGWLWLMEHEIRPYVPMVYYHVWDNYPHPHFNKPFYESNDFIASISKVTDDIVKTVSSTVENKYLPHAVNTEIFKKYPAKDVLEFKEKSFNQSNHKMGDKMIFFWNNRNARRKQSGTLVYWFKEFLDQVGWDKAMLIMHTDPKDQHGQDLEQILQTLNLTDGQILFSRQKMPQQLLAMVYNMVDCTINISNAEGLGLATLESLACETPVIVNMTGGLQEQVTDGKNWFGFGIEPAAKPIIGSQDVPYIYEDHLSKDDFLKAILKFYNLPKVKRDKMGKMGRKHILKNYNFETFKKQWVDLMLEIHEKCGSWDKRKGYSRWHKVVLEPAKEENK